MQHSSNNREVPLRTHQKWTGQLEGISMKTIPLKHGRMFKSYIAAHGHILHIMRADSKITAVHQIVTGRRKVTMLLSSSGAEKLTSGMVHLMADCTISSEVTNHKHDHEECSKSSNKWNKDPVRSNKVQTRKVRNWYIINMKMTYLTMWPKTSYLELVIILENKQHK